MRTVSRVCRTASRELAVIAPRPGRCLARPRLSWPDAEQLGHVQLIDKAAVGDEALAPAAFHSEAHPLVQLACPLVVCHNGELQVAISRRACLQNNVRNWSTNNP